MASLPHDPGEVVGGTDHGRAVAHHEVMPDAHGLVQELRGIRVGACVVDEQAHGEILGRCRQFGRRLGLAEIEHEVPGLGRDRRRHLCEHLAASRNQHDLDPSIAQEAGDRGPDAIRCSCDHCPGSVAF